MDEKGISDKKLRKAVAKVQGKGAVCSKDEGRWGKRLVNAEFAAIAVAHNIRKMMQRATVVISV